MANSIMKRLFAKTVLMIIGVIENILYDGDVEDWMNRN